ncbi:TetR/AcrR family transcriptional regulator [Rhizorhapis suberifaciens]|uniref:AcrR family transcriptional regulator n=1 Tax=Rhizorhapis suberifaciens TaxID=13656 RepID=A0A840HWS6_9SPHN|nr:TetR/AcrR family transcriptional regulator [Rhizorhapis suberifaciens]MBB4642812.1 AcrR family transcriptional regulator [Rhizorhapis suberifaciens]
MTKKPMEKPLGTKEAMIVAAERRFALHGLEGASLRQIALDSNQRNESAAHYHFGSREGLIRAILGHRISTINARREKRLEEARRIPGGQISARAIASVVIYPMAEEIFSNWRNCYWIRFISQLFAIDKFSFFADEFESSSRALVQAYDLMGSIPGIDPIVLEARKQILRHDVVWGLARVEAISFHERRETCELHIANLVDMIAAGISVAPSKDTIRKAEALGKAVRNPLNSSGALTSSGDTPVA